MDRVRPITLVDDGEGRVDEGEPAPLKEGPTHPRDPARLHIAGSHAEAAIAKLSPDETLAAMYEAAASIRLDLIYCPTLTGDLRKHWANRLGRVNLMASTAPSDIDALRGEFAPYEADWHDALHRDIAQIRHALWRLRELCRRYQGFLRSAAK